MTCACSMVWTSISRRGELLRCFFFQAEDGIRDYKVTGVQTCALPIFDQSFIELFHPAGERDDIVFGMDLVAAPAEDAPGHFRLGQGLVKRFVKGLRRSEERRVGKECRSRWSPYH